MPRAEFDSAMVAMNYFIGLVDERLKLPFPNEQYIEWEVGGICVSKRAYAIGRPKFLHDVRHLSASARVREIRMRGTSSNWLSAFVRAEDIVEVAACPTHNFYRYMSVETTCFFPDEDMPVLVREVSEQVNRFAKLV